MQRILSYLRITEWYDSKVPMLLSVLLYFYILNPDCYKLGAFCGIVFCYFIFVSLFLAFGYVINDFSDIEVDKLAGKQKIIADLPAWVIWGSFGLMFILGNAFILYRTNFNIKTIIFILVTYFFGAAYSIKQFRFKEKGVWGLIVSSVAQRCLPLLCVLVLVPVGKAEFALWVLLSFISGLRYILIHQIIDLENDLKANVSTYVSQKQSNVKFGVYLSFWVEIILLFVLIFKLIPAYKWILLFLVYYIIVERMIIIFVNRYMQKPCFFTFDAVPLEDLYNVYLPVILAVIVVINHIQSLYGWLLLALLCVYLFRSFKNKMAMVMVYLKIKMGGYQK